MTNPHPSAPSPTLARLQAEHPTLRFENCLEGALLSEAITALDKENSALRAQLAENEEHRQREFREHEVHRNWLQQELSKAVAKLKEKA